MLHSVSALGGGWPSVEIPAGNVVTVLRHRGGTMLAVKASEMLLEIWIHLIF